MEKDVIVIGGGMVGAAFAYGIAKSGKKVLVIDGADKDFRAARANLGLVWVQGKGTGTPAYTGLTLESSDRWPKFCEELKEISGKPIDYFRPGGLAFCMSEADFSARSDLIARTHNQRSEAYTEMVERPALERMMPAVTLGPTIVGASYCKLDGHVNPLQLYAALHAAIAIVGGEIQYRNTVAKILPAPGGGFRVHTSTGVFSAPRVIIAAGLATPALAGPLGLNMPLRPERGQLLVTERLSPIMPYPASGIRQGSEGTVMIGTTNEKADDTRVTMNSAITLARRAERIIPALGRVRLVRQWSGLRVLSPDKAPIYAQSPDHPGLFAAICHSGVTLAAIHAEMVGPAMAAGDLPESLSWFSNGRFDVQKCA
ncbi:FAD-binding oxidoreductase [Agrobacterium tumefaciens]|uniref:NAD(P)/FAD-dependent oxidoreductase n=1 Tax=Agrobacterium tumefaciens TaxID=358 RepID=UPI0015749908|nr:FAD-binding oxidoreductase [Agrobacterium tumefaciens]NSX84364.1 FAD-binding oxidoreductase [Agrobacterium tumefaciens]NTA50001.1 FAD-binding oxidoreductase [Agrobacterium tumefaciens]